MRTSQDKRATTIRLTADTKALLVNAARIRTTSESVIVEHAIQEFCHNHGITNTRYTMTANNSCYTLIKQDGDHVDVVDMQIRNGVALEQIRQNYASKYNSPVDLVVDEGALQ